MDYSAPPPPQQGLFSDKLHYIVSFFFLGRNLLMEFVYDSADAAGQNAVTVTTWHACQWALDKISQECPEINIREFCVETKFSGDKGAMPKNYIIGRGIEVQVEAYITESTLQSVLKVTDLFT